MKRYRAKFNPNRKGVYAISLVDEPAMEGDFIQFKKQNEIKFANVDESKRRIMGLILEPDKDVLRFDAEDNSYYTVRFEAQDIEEVAYNFQKQGNQNNSTIQHDGKNIEGVSFVETWIVSDSKVDKSANFGLEYPKGSWMGVMQLDNQEVWNEYVKTGKVKGFSIDAFMQFEEINLNKVNKMSDNKKESIADNIADAIKKGFAQLAENPFKKKTEKAEKDMTPEELEEKKKADAKKKAEKEKVALSTEAEKKVEFNSEGFIKSMIKDLSELLEPIKVELKKATDGMVELKKVNETLETKVLELGKLPATKSVKKAPAQLEYSKMSNYQKMLHNQGK